MRYLAVFTATLDAGKEIPHLETLKMQSEETSAAVQMLLDLVSDDAQAKEDDVFTSHVQHVVDLCERGDYDACLAAVKDVVGRTIEYGEEQVVPEFCHKCHWIGARSSPSAGCGECGATDTLSIHGRVKRVSEQEGRKEAQIADDGAGGAGDADDDAAEGDDAPGQEEQQEEDLNF